MRKKFASKAGHYSGEPEPPMKYSCHTCTKNCGKVITYCGEKSMVHRCKQCGQKVMYRYDPEVVFEYCDGCKVKLV